MGLGKDLGSRIETMNAGFFVFDSVVLHEKLEFLL